MAVISGANYKAIADAYATARNNLTAAVTYFYNAVYTIVLLNDVQPTIDLLGEFYTGYLINQGRLEATTSFDSAVRILQIHVVNNSVEGDLNEYLVDNVNGLGKVHQAWADLSAAVGFPINSGNVVP